MQQVLQKKNEAAVQLKSTLLTVREIISRTPTTNTATTLHTTEMNSTRTLGTEELKHQEVFCAANNLTTFSVFLYISKLDTCTRREQRAGESGVGRGLP
jgi:hypothetical protein